MHRQLLARFFTVFRLYLNIKIRVVLSEANDKILTLYYFEIFLFLFFHFSFLPATPLLFSRFVLTLPSVEPS